MEHTETCICGSKDINVLQKIHAPVELSEIQCGACGYKVAYPKAARPKQKTKGEVFEELLTIWNHTMISEKLEREIRQSEFSYLKEDLVQHLLGLSELIEAAKAENVAVSADGRKKLAASMLLVQRIIPALQGLETATLALIKEAVDAVADNKKTLKFKIKGEKS